MRRFSWATATLALVLGAAVACRPSCKAVCEVRFDRVPVPRYDQPRAIGPGRIGIVGDVQRTSVEGCLLGNEVNDDEQRILLSALAREQPAAVVLLGDLVFDGSSTAHWSYFDHLMVESGLDRVPLYPLLGNHEYFGILGPDLSHVRRRFSTLLGRTYYSVDWGRVRVILLDANWSKLGKDSKTDQRAWFNAEMAAARSSGQRGVLVLAHQSPYTQGPWVSEDTELRDLVKPHCASPLLLAVITAHAHGYERWEDTEGCRGVPFIVTAGGGGPRPPYRRKGSGPDASTVREWPRPFNYLTLEQDDARVTVRVHMLRTGERRVWNAPGETRILTFQPE